MSVIRSAATGETLALNAGGWTGVYGAEGTGPIVPVNVIPPAFTAIPTQVGGVARVYVGDWVPVGTTTFVEIGYGATAAAFVPVVTGTQATLTSAFAGQRLSARVTASYGDVTITPIFVDSGQTISGVDTNFPADIAASAWTAAEIRNAGPEGRRRITVSSSVTVPTGFLLKLYAGGVDLGLPTSAGATMTPGTTYDTVGTLPVGSTAYNSLAWLRQSDGAIKRAHPDGQQKSFQMLGLITAEPPTTKTNWSPDIIVGSLTAVRTAAAAKIAAGFGTSTDDYMIGLNANTSGTLDLSGLDNIHATATGRRIFVRHVGTFGEAAGGVPTCSIQHTGAVRFTNSRGIWTSQMFIHTGQSSGITAEGSDICGMMYCYIRVSTVTAMPAPDYGVELHDSPNFTFAHCVVRGTNLAAVLFSHADGIKCYGNQFDYIRTDDYKVFHRFDNGIFERNWGCRRRITGPAGPHFDFWQNQGKFEQNCLFFGNVLLQQVGGGIINQVFFHRFGSGQDPDDWLNYGGTRWEQNIGCSGLGLLLISGGALTSGAGARYNTSVTFGDPDPAVGAVIEPAAPRDYNYAAIAGQFNATTTNAQNSAGPNGLARKTGDTDGTFNPSGSRNVVRDYSVIAQDFEFGIPWMTDSVTGAPFAAEEQQTLRAFRPKTGTRLHWSHANPVGAYLRMRELFDTTYRATASAAAGYTVIPHAWPVLPVWRETYNRDGYVVDGWTGNYDADGFVQTSNPPGGFDLPDTTLRAGQRYTLDFTANVGGLTGTWTVLDGRIPTGMAHASGVVTGPALVPQSQTSLTLRLTHSAGTTDVNCRLTIVAAELVTNGLFTTDASGWTASGATLGVTAVSGNNALEVTSTGANGQARQQVSVVNGYRYLVRARLLGGTASTKSFLLGSAAGGSQYGSLTATGRARFNAAGTALHLAANSSAGTAQFDDLSVTLISPGLTVTELNTAYNYTQYQTSFPADRVVDCTEASWIVKNQGTPLQSYPVKINNSTRVTMLNGTINGQVNQTADWEVTYVNSAGLFLAGCTGGVIRRWKIHTCWDAIRIRGGDDWAVDNCYIYNARDDAIENDDGLPGSITNCLWDGVFVGLSGTEAGATAERRSNIITLDNNLIRMKQFLYQGNQTHQSPFKWGFNAPSLKIYNTIIAIEKPTHIGDWRFQEALDLVQDSSGNYFLNLSDTALSGTYPNGANAALAEHFTIQQGATARATWAAAKAAWAAANPWAGVV